MVDIKPEKVRRTLAVEKKPLFALSQPDAAGVSTVIIGLPKGAWKHIRYGRTVHADLSSAGLPVRFVVFGGESHASVKKLMEKLVFQSGAKGILDKPREDFSIKTPGEVEEESD